MWWKDVWVGLGSSGFLKSPAHPLDDLGRIRALKDRLGRPVDNRKKRGDRLHPTIAWRIVVLIQITIIPGNLWAQIQQGLGIQTLARATPTGTKTDHDNRLMRSVWVLFDQTLEKLLAREGCHRVGHVCWCRCEDRWQ